MQCRKPKNRGQLDSELSSYERNAPRCLPRFDPQFGEFLAPRGPSRAFVLACPTRHLLSETISKALPTGKVNGITDVSQGFKSH
jgi:hypothetical protein